MSPNCHPLPATNLINYGFPLCQITEKNHAGGGATGSEKQNRLANQINREEHAGEHTEKIKIS